MFNFTTQNLLNYVNVWKYSTDNEITSTVGKNVIFVDDENMRYPQIRIGNVRFNWPAVLDVYKASYVPENLASVTFDLAKISTLVAPADQVGTYRIALYIGLSMNSQDSFYANDFVYKGKPFYIEFLVKNANELTGDTLAKRIKKIAELYLILQADSKLLSVSTEGTKITFTATNGYQIIQKAYLQHFDEKAIQIDCCTNGAEFVNLIEGIKAIYTVEDGVVTIGDSPKYLDSDGKEVSFEDDDTKVPITPGTEEFCGYSWIIHNLRLPTGANTQWWSPIPGEMPVVGGKYNQYIIRLIKERDGIAGGILGQRATTVTTHVFYVLDNGDNISQFESIMNELGTMQTIADLETSSPYKTPSTKRVWEKGLIQPEPIYDVKTDDEGEE